MTILLHQPYPSVTSYPIENYLSSSQFSSTYQFYLLAITSAIEPKSYKEAVEDENWRYAVEDELVALIDLGTFSVVALPPGKKGLGC